MPKQNRPEAVLWLLLEEGLLLGRSCRLALSLVFGTANSPINHNIFRKNSQQKTPPK